MLFQPSRSSLLALLLGAGLAFASEVSLTDSLIAAPATSARPLPVGKLGVGSVGIAGERTEAIVAAAPAMRRSPAAYAADLAMESLTALVLQQSHPKALRSAVEAYFNYRAAHPEKVRKPYLYYVDFGLPATQPRGYVFDMDALRVVEGPFTVAHGSGSASRGSTIPTQFSNRVGSNATSLGLYLTQETYGFRGKAGGRPYRSIGLRLEGVSGVFNSAARKRGVVVHGAPYVTEEKAGRSEGCPAMEPERAERLLPLLAGGSLVFHFSPVDDEWLALEPWTREELAYIIPTPGR